METRQTGQRTACVVCRQRKTACDKVQPQCGLCQRNGFDCNYASTRRKPGLRAGFVSQLEQRVVQLEAKVRNLENGIPTSTNRTDQLQSVNNVEEDMEMSPPSSPLDSSNFTSTDHTAATEVERTSIQFDETEAQLSTTHQQPPSNDTGGFSSVEYDTLVALLDIWFDRYHGWCPILHRRTCFERLEETRNLPVAGQDLAIRAVIAFVWIDLNPDQPLVSKDFANLVARDVAHDAIGKTSCDSLAALVITALFYCGNNDQDRFHALLSVCRRKADQLNLTKSALRQVSGETSVTEHTIQQEQAVRLYWTVEVLDSLGTFDVSWRHYNSLERPPHHTVLPCADSLWDDRGQIKRVGTLSGFAYSSAFSLSIIVAVSELNAVRKVVQEPRDTSELDSKLEWQSKAQCLDERLSIWREEFVAAVFRIINAESMPTEEAEMDANIVLTNCALNWGVITLLQSMAPLPSGMNPPADVWHFATNRCVYAADNMAAKVRRMKDHQIRTSNPVLFHAIFAAARFYIVYTKALDADVPISLRSLAYALHICSERWPLANHYEMVIRTAVSEHRTPIQMSCLPNEFFDLRYSVSAVNEVILRWAQNNTAATPASLGYFFDGATPSGQSQGSR